MFIPSLPSTLWFVEFFIMLIIDIVPHTFVHVSEVKDYKEIKAKIKSVQ